MDRAGLKPDAASVTFRSVTGYTRRFSIDEADELLLATTVGDETLSHRHGFPLRLVAPGRRGYQWVKWVATLEVNDTEQVASIPAAACNDADAGDAGTSMGTRVAR